MFTLNGRPKMAVECLNTSKQTVSTSCHHTTFFHLTLQKLCTHTLSIALKHLRRQTNDIAQRTKKNKISLFAIPFFIQSH